MHRGKITHYGAQVEQRLVAVTFQSWMHRSKRAPRHDLIGTAAFAESRGRISSYGPRIVTMVMVMTTRAMMTDVFMAIPVHAMAIMMMAMHVMVTAVVPGSSSSSMGLGQGCRSGDQNCCAQASQEFPTIDHCPPRGEFTGSIGTALHQFLGVLSKTEHDGNRDNERDGRDLRRHDVAEPVVELSKLTS